MAVIVLLLLTHGKCIANVTVTIASFAFFCTIINSTSESYSSYNDGDVCCAELLVLVLLFNYLTVYAIQSLTLTLATIL